MKLIEINTPEYSVDSEPDYKTIGGLIDTQIKQYFMGKNILLRGIGSQEHSNKSVNDLIEIIKQTGTDRYDPYVLAIGMKTLKTNISTYLPSLQLSNRVWSWLGRLFTAFTIARLACTATLFA